MCGRFGLEYNDDFYPRFLLKNLLPSLFSRYNIAPGQITPIIIKKKDGNYVENMKWGLVPHWANSPDVKYKIINSRVETVAEKPVYKKTFQTQRCLVPASNFYEWQKVNSKTKTPYNIKLKDEKYFAMAGIYDIWVGPNKENLYTFSILTTNPLDEIAFIHNRMPVILDKNEEDLWISNDTPQELLLELARSQTKQTLEVYPISNKVNNPENDSVEIIEPVII